MSQGREDGRRFDPEAVRARRAAIDERRRHMNTMLTVRWVLVGASALLGAAIVASGGWLIGGLLLAMAVGRMAMLVSIERRRRAWRARAGAGGASPGPGAPIDV